MEGWVRPLEPVGGRRFGLLLKIVAPIVAILVVCGGIGLALWSDTTVSSSANVYQQRRATLNAQLQAASQQGFTAQDLAPIKVQVTGLDGQRQPWWIPDRANYYQRLAAQAGQLQGQLAAHEQQLLQQARDDASQQVTAAKNEIAQAQQANAATMDVQPLQTRLAAVTRDQAAANDIKQMRAVTQQATALVADATTLTNSTQAENQAIQQAAQQLTGGLGAMQSIGNSALASGRNDATVAAYMNKGSMITKGYDTIQRAYQRLETFGAMISSASASQAAIGAAGAQRYSNAIHTALIGGFPSQTIIVSFQAQHAWAYQDGKVVMDNAVTTGVRGVTDYGTDFGPMKILWRSHPWTFKSPWPKSSPHYYPDTTVQWVTFFTNTGESFHDAYWEPDSLLGPGSQYNSTTQSHGCVHLPQAKAQWVYDWARQGTPVIIYPGDGSTVSNQLSQITTDSSGVPQSS